MVLQNGYVLQLIDAETRLPLNEFRGPSGEVHYAEAKPEGEYFLRFQVLENDQTTKGATTADTAAEKVFYFRPSVDGKDLGFYTNLTCSDGARDVGLWTYENGVGTNKALKFEPAIRKAPEEDISTNRVSEDEETMNAAATTTTSITPRDPLMLSMGIVQVQIYEAVFAGKEKRVYSAPSLTESETVVAPSAPVSASSSVQEGEEEHKSETPSLPEPVPVLRSREGATKFEEKYEEECPTYKPGQLNETITIHYASTEALVQAGILVPVLATAGTVPQVVGGAPITTLPAVTAPLPVATTKSPTDPPTIAPTQKETTKLEQAICTQTQTNDNQLSAAPKQLTGLLVPNPLAGLPVSTSSEKTTAATKRPASDDSNVQQRATKVACTEAKNSSKMGPEASADNKNRQMVSTK